MPSSTELPKSAAKPADTAAPGCRPKWRRDISATKTKTANEAP